MALIGLCLIALPYSVVFAISYWGAALIPSPRMVLPLFAVGFLAWLMLLVIYEWTKAPARGKMPWVIHKRLLLAAHIISGSAFWVAMMFGAISLLKKYVFA